MTLFLLMDSETRGFAEVAVPPLTSSPSGLQGLTALSQQSPEDPHQAGQVTC